LLLHDAVIPEGNCGTLSVIGPVKYAPLVKENGIVIVDPCTPVTSDAVGANVREGNDDWTISGTLVVVE
jgi:hypothetical protein